MPYLILLFFLIIYALYPSSFGFDTHSPLWSHFSYPFSHASWLHLMVNSLSFLAAWGLLKKFIKPSLFAPLTYLIAVGSSFLSTEKFPTVGASGTVFAMMGLWLGKTYFDKFIKITNRVDYAVFHVAVIISLVSSYFHTGSNFRLHVLCLLGGLLSSLLFCFRKPLK